MTALSPAEPATFEDAAAILSSAGADERAVRIVGAGTKPWLAPPAGGERLLRTLALDRIRAHDPGDMTATLEAGVTLEAAQARFAGEDQMLALDPPSAAAQGPASTIGGIVASGDCGPLAHRYGGPRDLVVGATVALADGTIARSGGTVIKNVAGYDVAKLFCGAFGTLGLILSVNVRLHPRQATVTATATATDGGRLAAGARVIAALPAELDALDVAWENGAGRLLARCAGPQAEPRARRVAEAMAGAGLYDAGIELEDGELWERQRSGQRTTADAVLHVAAAPTALAPVIAAAQAEEARVVGRAALGRLYLTVAPERVPALRERLPTQARVSLRDCPPATRERIPEPWGRPSEPALALMRALKARFDPVGICNPGAFVGGI